MLIAIWDFLFTRRHWVILEKVPVFGTDTTRPKYIDYILQDQFGNIKVKRT